ncbi:MAG: hypothetical protein K9G30_07945 [Parvibaculum sp.]|nr:hypothetical protein [Parvibaculum sp.]
MTAFFPGKFSRFAVLPIWLLLVAAFAWPVEAHAVDARSEQASLILTSKSMEAAAAGNLTGAQRYLEEAVVANPANLRAFTQLGIVHLARGNKKLARKYFLIALSIDPADPEALSRLAHLDIAEGDRASATEALRKLRSICASCVQTRDLAHALGSENHDPAPAPGNPLANP